MAKIIDFNQKEKVDKKAITSLIKELKSLRPECVESMFVHIGLVNENGERSTYTLTRNLDFYDLGYLDSYIQHLKLNILETHIVFESDSQDGEISDLVQTFKKEEDSEEDDTE